MTGWSEQILSPNLVEVHFFRLCSSFVCCPLVGIFADECERLVNILYYAASERLVIIKNELICSKKVEKKNSREVGRERNSISKRGKVGELEAMRKTSEYTIIYFWKNWVRCWYLIWHSVRWKAKKKSYFHKYCYRRDFLSSSVSSSSS